MPVLKKNQALSTSHIGLLYIKHCPRNPTARSVDAALVHTSPPPPHRYLFVRSLIHSFIHFVLPSFRPFSLPPSLPPSLPSFLLSFLPSLPPSFLLVILSFDRSFILSYLHSSVHCSFSHSNSDFQKCSHS